MPLGVIERLTNVW